MHDRKHRSLYIRLYMFWYTFWKVSGSFQNVSDYLPMSGASSVIRYNSYLSVSIYETPTADIAQFAQFQRTTEKEQYHYFSCTYLQKYE